MFRSLRSRLTVASSFVILSAGTLPDPAAGAPVTTTPQLRATVAKVAKRKVNAPYRFGATGPRAFDCSGLVGYAYRKAGRRLSVRTSQQMWKLGARIKRPAVRAGDLVFTWSRSYGHVGIALNAKQYVHAPAPGRRVTIAPIPSGGGFIGARRP